jgi:mediator of RNA polymerase II transcription subunit 31
MRFVSLFSLLTTCLQFVQCLSNPLYLNHLATQKLLDDPEFIAYLSYLQYFAEPKYIKYLS